MMPAPLAIPAPAALFGLAGLAFGYAYFLALRRSVDLFVARRAWLPSLLWMSVRIVAAALFFALVAHGGATQAGRRALPLLAAFAGFLVARQLAVRSAKRAV